MPNGIVDTCHADLLQYESLLNDTKSSVAKVLRDARLELPESSSSLEQDLSRFLDSSLRHHSTSDEELNARCSPIIADYYRLLCNISEHEKTSSEDIEKLDKLGDQFIAMQALFYNADVRLKTSLKEQQRSPSWQEENLINVKAQLEKDKTYREYRYIANTKALAEAKRLINSPLWQAYKKYQTSIEKHLPEGTPIRIQLQKFKKSLGSTLDGRLTTFFRQQDKSLSQENQKPKESQSRSVAATYQHSCRHRRHSSLEKTKLPSLRKTLRQHNYTCI